MNQFNLFLVKHPSRYLGTELNSVHKDLSKVKLKVALAFPDAYEVGMSHIGLQILYHLLNQKEDIATERVYAPWLDMEQWIREKNLPLCSLESSIPLREFDIIGFSLQYELSYTNVVNMLDLARIPFYAQDRDEKFPLILAGGICCFNPEPVAELFDALVIGDGEEVIFEICECYLKWKKGKGKKRELLENLSEIAGVYVPSLFKPIYNANRALLKIEPLKRNYSLVKKRLVIDLEKTPYITTPIVPFMRIIHDRINVEIARGCTRGCRFCLAGMVCRPVRERSPQTITELIDKSLRTTGYEDVSLTSLSSGDYSNIGELVKMLMQRLEREKVALSLPSLRVETLTSDLIEEIRKVRKTGFTIAPEAGTQRLRDVINKGITEEQIFKTIEMIYKGGWRSVKLYFMVGLPTETEDDRWGIIELCRKIKTLIRRNHHLGINVNVNISSFVPKPHTPFQWESQLSLSEIKEILRFLIRELRKVGVHPKWQKPEMSLLEGIFSRGDRQLTKTLITAHRIGCRFDGWKESFRFDLWKRAFDENGISIDFYANQPHSIEEVLPWEHIDSLIEKRFLERERVRALNSQLTSDCRNGRCQNCGVCEHIKIEKKSKDHSQKTKIEIYHEITSPVCSQAKKLKKIRGVFFKLNEARYLSHLEMITIFSRALRRARISVKYTEGFHPLPRIITGLALPLGVESICEKIDFIIQEWIEPETFIKKMNRELPQGLKFLKAEEIPLEKSLESDNVILSRYLIYLNTFEKYFFELSENFRDLIERGEQNKISSEFSIDKKFLLISVPKKKGIIKVLKEFYYLKPEVIGDIRILKIE